MNKISIDIVSKSGVLPEYKTEFSAGCDLCSTNEPTRILPGHRAFFNTGVSIAIPNGFEGQVRGRSGLNKNHGLVVPIGTIDADYRGEIGVVVYNLGQEEVLIKKGDRIAQLVIAPVLQAEWNEVESLDITERGEKGFGSTGR